VTGLSVSISFVIRGAKKFLVGSSSWDHILGSLGAGAAVVVLSSAPFRQKESASASYACGTHFSGQAPPRCLAGTLISLCVRA
jgi:hypothetical protein